MPVYEAADKALETFQEEFVPVETFSEFLDVAGQCSSVAAFCHRPVSATMGLKRAWSSGSRCRWTSLLVSAGGDSSSKLHCLGLKLLASQEPALGGAGTVVPPFWRVASRGFEEKPVVCQTGPKEWQSSFLVLGINNFSGN